MNADKRINREWTRMKGKISPQRHKGHEAGKFGQGSRSLCISVADWIVLNSRLFASIRGFVSDLRSSAVSSSRLWGGCVLGSQA
jgi:hypothetical protein